MTPVKLEVGSSPLERARRDDGRDQRIVAFIVQLVALATGIMAGEIAAPTRERADAARARQIAMYLAHTACNWPLARVASAFGRDRSTASYACRVVEDLRENAAFDFDISRLEGCIRVAPIDAPPVWALPQSTLMGGVRA